MSGGTPSHTEISRLVKPHARVWGIVVLLIFCSVLDVEQVIGQFSGVRNGEVSSFSISHSDVSLNPFNKKATGAPEVSFLKKSDKSISVSGRVNLFDEAELETGRQKRMMSSADHVVFSEVLFRENRSGEWIELYNPTSQTIDLEGFEIEDDGVSIYFSEGFSIAAGSFFTIVKRSDRSGFERVHGIQADLYTGGLENLNDKKGRVRLFDPDGNEVDRVAWDKSGYRDFNVGRGNSIIRVNPNIDTDTDDDWDQGSPEGEPGTQAFANQSPVVFINGPYSGLAGQPVAFSSAGTNDPDGNIASYLWEFGDGNTSASSNPNHSYATPGTYTAELTVTDNDGAESNETTTVQVISNTFTWSGLENNVWENAGNWLGGIAPGNTPIKDIEIPSSGNNPVLESSLNISGVSLIIADGADLTISSSGSLVIENDGAISTGASSSVTLTSGSAYVNKSLSDPGLVIEREITGNKGWRMVSSPFALTFEDIFGGAFVTQGFIGSDYPDLQPNLLSWDEANAGTTLQGWRTLGAITDITLSGSGYYYYVFDGAGRPDGDLFYSDTLPITMSLRGTEPNISSDYSFDDLTFTPRDTEDQSDETDAVFIERNGADQGWNLIGNPTASSLDWDASGWTKENISETIYVWDPNANGGAGDYLVWNGSNGSLQSGKIAPLQAFWVKATGPDPELSFSKEVKVLSGNFKGKATEGFNAQADVPAVKFSLSALGFEKDIWLTFSNRGKTGYDKWDAFHLAPMSENWMTFFSSSLETESPGMVINHLPDVQGDKAAFIQLVMGVYEHYEAREAEFKLRWERTPSWPDGLNLYLQDQLTEFRVEIGADADSLIFFHRSPEATADFAGKSLNRGERLPSIPLKPGAMVTQTGSCKDSECGHSQYGKAPEPRFTILVSNTEISEYLPSRPALRQNYPNPFNPETTISFTLPAESGVKVQIFDLLGREVAVLADGIFEAGSHQLRWSAGSLSSGIYLYRMTINGRSAVTRKMTLMK